MPAPRHSSLSRSSLTPLGAPYNGPYTVPARPLRSRQKHKEFIHSENLSMWKCLTWGARPEALIFVQVFALSTVPTMVPTTVPTQSLHGLYSPNRSTRGIIHSEHLCMRRFFTRDVRPEAPIFVQTSHDLLRHAGGLFVPSEINVHSAINH